MMVSYRTLMSKLITPLSGMTLVKVNSSEGISLWSTDKESKSAIINVSDSLHLVHLQAGDVIVQGSYNRSRKLFIIDSINELNTAKIMRLEKSNNFTKLYEIPEGMSRVRVDHSLGNISNNILAAINGLDRLSGVNCHSELKFEGKVVQLERLPKNENEWDKVKRGVIFANNKGIAVNSFFNYNQFTGKLDYALFTLKNESVDGEYALTKGVSIIVKNNGRVLEVMLDLKVLGFSDFFTKTLLQDTNA